MKQHHPVPLKSPKCTKRKVHQLVRDRVARKRWEIRPTWSRRRSNFFQYWNIDPTSAAILSTIFKSGYKKYMGWIPPVKQRWRLHSTWEKMLKKITVLEKRMRTRAGACDMNAYGCISAAPGIIWPFALDFGFVKLINTDVTGWSITSGNWKENNAIVNQCASPYVSCVKSSKLF